MDYVRQEKPLLNEPKLRCGLAMQAGPAEGRLSTGGLCVCKTVEDDGLAL